MKVAIILCVKNGEKYLFEQLDSIRSQSYKNFDLFISYNHSTDSSLKIIEEYIIRNSDLSISLQMGSDKHFANNFIISLKKIEGEYDYFAFCDQDDIWLANHLSRAIIALKKESNSLPAIYCSRTMLIDKNGKKLRESMYFKKSPSFKNALVQSIAGGNTMIFNKSAYNLIYISDEKKNIVSHDWLLYLYVSAAGGKVLYSHEPSVLYRQHPNNKIGSNLGLFNKIKRILMLLKGEFNNYNVKNFYQLDKFKYMTEENSKTYTLYKNSLSGNIFKKVLSMNKSGVYRQTVSGQIALYINLFLNNQRREKN